MGMSAVPREFTGLDDIVDIVFKAAEDVAVDELDEPDLSDSATEVPAAAELSGPKFTVRCRRGTPLHIQTNLVPCTGMHLQ